MFFIPLLELYQDAITWTLGLDYIFIQRSSKFQLFDRKLINTIWLYYQSAWWYIIYLNKQFFALILKKIWVNINFWNENFSFCKAQSVLYKSGTKSMISFFLNGFHTYPYLGSKSSCIKFCNIVNTSASSFVIKFEL